MFLFLLLPFFLASSHGQELLAFKNETHIICVTDNRRDPLYVEPLEVQGTKRNNLIESEELWKNSKDWVLKNSTETLHATVVDKRWQDFSVVKEDNLSFPFKTSFSFWVYQPEKIEIFMKYKEDKRDYHTDETVSEWSQFTIYTSQNTTSFLKNNVEYRSFRINPWELRLKANLNFWKVEDYKIRVSYNSSKTPTKISILSPCLDLYVYLCEYCFLEVEANGLKKTLNGINTTQNNLHTPQKIQLENVQSLSLQKYTLNGKYEGYWAIDIRDCTPIRSDHVIYEHNISNLTEAKNFTCKSLKGTKKTQIQDIDYCKQTGVLGEKCNIFCYELFGKDKRNCAGFKISYENYKWFDLPEKWKKTVENHQNIQNYCSKQSTLSSSGTDRNGTTTFFSATGTAIGGFLSIITIIIVMSVISNNEKNKWLQRNLAIKHSVLMDMAKMALSHYTRRSTSGHKSNDKTELLVQAILNFNVTILEEDPNDVIANIWENSPKQNRDSLLIIDVNDSNLEAIKKVLTYLDVNEVEANVVLVGKTFDDMNLSFEKWKILKNFSNILDNFDNSDWCSSMKRFKVSLNGPDSFDLAKLVDIERSVAEDITVKLLVEMSQEDQFLIGRSIELPPTYISRNFLQDGNSIKEEEMCGQYNYNQNVITVICGSSGMGKTTVMHKLRTKSSWAVYVSLKEFSALAGDRMNVESTLLNVLKQNEENLLLSKIQTILFQEGNIELFLDDFDKLEEQDRKLIVDYIPQILLKSIKISVSSTKSASTDLCHTFKDQVKLFEIEELNQRQQDEYINQRFKDKEELVSKFNQIFSVGTSRELLGKPLYLQTISDILLENETDLLTKVLKLFFEKMADNYMKSIGINAAPKTKDIVYRTYLQKYEIAALTSCLEPSDLKKLNVELNKPSQFFNQMKKTGDIYGIIKGIENDRMIFEYNIFAQYFACVWFKNNRQQMNALELETTYSDLHAILSVLDKENCDNVDRSDEG